MNLDALDSLSLGTRSEQLRFLSVGRVPCPGSQGISKRGALLSCISRFHSHFFLHTLLTISIATGALGATVPADYISDHPELILSSDQSWGELGFDTAAHAADKPGELLRIGDRTFAKGLGHHANGAITLLLDGRYESFDADVGLQPCAGGSVIFRGVVDGQQRFDSGVMRTGDAPKPVHLSVVGAQELRLEASDAGDGINCDMANWADARLTPALNPARTRSTQPTVDMARFARVVTWEPERKDGARASRIEEFRAEDLFTESDLVPNRDRHYQVPAGTNGVGCIGLQWLNRRALRELALEFADRANIPAPNAVRVEGWFGESAWQGNWKPLAGECRQEGARLVFRLTPNAGVVQKVRWLLPPPVAASFSLRSRHGAVRKAWWMPPAGLTPALVRLSAFTRSTWATTNLFVQVDPAKPGSNGELTVYNGERVAAPGSRERPSEATLWKLTRPLRLAVRYSRPSSFKSDPTVLRFWLPAGNVSVAVEDVLSNECVYLPDYGLFVAREPLPVTLADYRRKIAGRKTILEQVRALPDQTLAQAMHRTHHDFQREGPVLLSLACDNTKFVADRDGALVGVTTTNAASDRSAVFVQMRPQFGGGKPDKLTRALDGGWLPIPISTVEQDGVVYHQRTFVAPCDEPGVNPARLNRRAVCVVEFVLTNSLAAARNAELSLKFTLGDRKQPATLTRGPRGWLVSVETGPIGSITTAGAGPLETSVQNGVLKLGGTLPPNSASSVVVFLPAAPNELPTTLDVASLRLATEAYWKAALAPAMEVETPDALLNNLIRSSQVRCLIDARNEAGGERVAAWIAAMSYGPLESEAHSVIRGMDFMGHADFARRSLDFFVHRYNTDGFLTTGYTTFGTAWHLWTLGEHYQLTCDTDWLRPIAPELARAGRWIVRQTEKTKQAAAASNRAPEFGLMPPGVLADWNAFAYHFAMNAYYFAALRELGAALGDLGHPDAALFTRHEAELRANTLRAYAWTQARSPALALRDGTWIAAYPSQVHSPGKLGDFFPGQDAGRSWCYDVEIGAHQLVPAGVLDPHSREVGRMMDHMEDVQFLADGWFDYGAATNQADWFNLGGFSKVQPYYTRNCEVYALRDDVKPFVRSYFNTIAAMLNPEVLTMWEHFHHSGAWDKTHETGYFLYQTRTMLVQERGRDLWLVPFITSNWLRDGQRVSVRNAPTRFGNVSYEIASHIADGFIEATIEPPRRNPARRIVVRLRHPNRKRIQSVIVNGRRHRVFDAARETITLHPGASAITVRAEY